MNVTLKGFRPVLRSLTETLDRVLGVLLEMVRKHERKDMVFACLVLICVSCLCLLALIIILYFPVALLAGQEIPIGTILLTFIVLPIIFFLGFLICMGPVVHEANRVSLKNQFDTQRRNLGESPSI